MSWNDGELAQLWHEFVVFSPSLDQAAFAPTDFCEWLNTEPDNTYGLPEVTAFLAEKERREGTALSIASPVQPPASEEQKGETSVVFWDDEAESEPEPREMPAVFLNESGPCCMCGKPDQQRGCFRCGRPVCMDPENSMNDSGCGGWIMDWWSNGAMDPDDGNEFWCKECIAEQLAGNERGGDEA